MGARQGAHPGGSGADLARSSTETLKNLILGGIGSATIVDGAKVTSEDLGTNFFFEESCVGEGRAKGCCTFLQELNENVQTGFVDEDPAHLVEKNPQFFKDFTLVIATELSERALVKLDGICRTYGIPLLICRTNGLVGSIRISVQEHIIEDAKPENPVWDLRLDKPWPELLEFCKSFQLDACDDVAHSHVPYVALLVQATEMWQKETMGEAPTSKASSAFKKFVRGMQRSIDGVPIDEENFKEAVQNAYYLWAPARLPKELSALFEDPKAEIDADSSDFWILIASMREYVAGEGAGALPLDGGIPDMTATTDLYVKLQHVYIDRAEKEKAAFSRYVEANLKKLNRDPLSIAPEKVAKFCKFARFCGVARYPSLAAECEPSKRNTEGLSKFFGSDEYADNAAIYLLLRAVDKYTDARGHVPGSFKGDFEEDVVQLKSIATALAADLGLGSDAVHEDYLTEIVRFGGSQLHTVGAIMGGIAAQEAIKVITHLFAPIEGTFVYNGIKNTSAILKL